MISRTLSFNRSMMYHDTFVDFSSEMVVRLGTPRLSVLSPLPPHPEFFSPFSRTLSAHASYPPSFFLHLPVSRMRAILSTLFRPPPPPSGRHFITAQRVCTRFITAAALWQYVNVVLPASIAIQIRSDRATNSLARERRDRESCRLGSIHLSWIDDRKRSIN